jgi:hypothetical protein
VRVRTIVAPLGCEVETQLGEMDPQLARLARRYIRRLRLEPYLGVPVARGTLAEHGCRRIYFDRDDQPDDLLGGRRSCKRHGDQDLSEGPRYRIVYWVREAPRTDMRVIRVLAVGEGHPDPPRRNAYELARQQLRRLIERSAPR